MIRLDQPPATVRRLLWLLRHPHLLEREPLASRLREAFQAVNCRAALLQLIDRTFVRSPHSQRLREILLRCDVEGQKARAAAAAMNLSLRQFYRWRAEAIDALTQSIERLHEFTGTDAPGDKPVYCAMCYQRIVQDREDLDGLSG